MSDTTPASRRTSVPADGSHGAGAAPDQPTRLGGRSWSGALKRTVAEFREDNLPDWAVALTTGARSLIETQGVAGLLAIVGLAGAFAFYVAHFGSYNEVYGTLGGVII